MNDLPSPPRDWDAFRSAHEKGPMTLAEIGRAFGISMPPIYRRIEQEGWLRRRPRGFQTQRRAMLQRLRKLVSSEVEALEGCIEASRQDMSLADREKLAKVAASLVKLIEAIATL